MEAISTPAAQPFRLNKGEPYYAVDLEFFAVDSVCEFDIYLKTGGHYVLYRAAHLPFSQADKFRLQEARIRTIYILCESEKDIRRFYEGNLSNIIDNKKIDNKKKANILYQCASGIAQEIFENPDRGEAIGSSKNVVNNTIKLMANGSDAFVQMISLSSHDYYTYTHCVNVMTFSIGLLSAMGIKDSQVLKEVGMGALLHDIGKAKVPLEVLNKPGPLNEEEWQVMKQHPVFGFEMLSDSPVPDRGKDVVIQHHEKISGAGYPYGLKGEQIPLVSQVVSICDAYDAMTTNRVYQKAMKPYDAFRIITQEMKTHFDPKLIEAFIRLLNLKKKI
jgi:putative nucleotidyltransferase with HDIG domain